MNTKKKRKTSGKNAREVTMTLTNLRFIITVLVVTYVAKVYRIKRLRGDVELAIGISVLSADGKESD